MSDDYETPRWLLDIAFPDGYFDPCPIRGKKNGPDGLKIDWPTDRPVFINPPYSVPLPWVRRAAEHKGPVALLLLLTPDSEWWVRYSRFFKVTIIQGRMRFLRWTDGKQRSLSGGEAPEVIDRNAAGGASGGFTSLYNSWWWKDGDRGR